jgi:hypothetical protein
MNMVSVITGMFFMGAMAYALRKTFSVPYWVTWLLFFSTPMFVLTFTFSNEMAVAMCFLALGLASSLSSWRFGNVLSGIFCGLALWAYLPVLLLGPMFLCWVYSYPANSPQKERIFRVLKISSVFVVTAAVFWCVFIRIVPQVSPLLYSASLQYRAAVLLYASCPSVLLISVLTVLGYFTRRLRNALFLILACLPMLFLPGIFTHKHLFISSLAIVVPAAIAVARSRLWLRCVLLGSIGMWCLFSVSPFGVYGPVRGADIFVPTSDGPAPTGAYLGFYYNAKRGIYQEKYADEIYCVERGMDALVASGFRARMLGNFNRHFALPYFYELGRPDWIDREGKQRLQTGPLMPVPEDVKMFVIRSSYLRSNYLSAEMNNQMDAWLNAGKVRIVDIGDSDVFPAVIEVGDAIPENTEGILGKRILFARAHDEYQGMFQTRLDSAAFKPLFWVASDQTKDITASPVYSDAHFSAYTAPVPGASLWRLERPAVLLRYADPSVAYQRRADLTR